MANYLLTIPVVEFILIKRVREGAVNFASIAYSASVSFVPIFLYYAFRRAISSENANIKCSAAQENHFNLFLSLCKTTVQ